MIYWLVFAVMILHPNSLERGLFTYEAIKHSHSLGTKQKPEYRVCVCTCEWTRVYSVRPGVWWHRRMKKEKKKEDNGIHCQFGLILFKTASFSLQHCCCNIYLKETNKNCSKDNIQIFFLLFFFSTRQKVVQSFYDDGSLGFGVTQVFYLRKHLSLKVQTMSLPWWSPTYSL